MAANPGMLHTGMPPRFATHPCAAAAQINLEDLA